MRKLLTLCSLLAVALTAPAFASCKDAVAETRKDIEQNKDDYTLESRTKAEGYLAKADLNRVDLNPLPDADCYEMVRKAKAELRQGKKKD